MPKAWLGYASFDKDLPWYFGMDLTEFPDYDIMNKIEICFFVPALLRRIQYFWLSFFRQKGRYEKKITCRRR